MARRLSVGDATSYSNPEEWVSDDITVNLTADFKAKTLKGCVEHHLVRRTSGSNTVLFDSKDLTIARVYAKETGKELSYKLGEPQGCFGSELRVTLHGETGPKFSIVIDYETSPDASALQWMDKNQTAGGEHPYLFSQCQAIHARSMFPCQDTSAVKTTFTAHIQAPSELKVLVSAVQREPEDNGSGTPLADGLTMTSFHQPVPIPSYLFAIVVGDLKGNVVSDRVTIYTEPKVLPEAAYEFALTEASVAIAEEICGPYVWGRYDLLVLPPSFPFGGMENPSLTFITPTLIAGDRSLTSVVAHEIAHSWTGNLVTNSNPDHFWLNEGHTVFLERKIIARLLKDPCIADFAYLMGWDMLQSTVDEFGADHGFTKLVQNHEGVDPDDSFSRVPYEKGSCFLYYLETKLGGPDVFEEYLRAYIKKFAKKSINSDEWKDYLFEYFSDKKNVLDTIDFDTWLHSPGMPPIKPDYDDTLRRECKELCDWWVSCDIDVVGEEDLEQAGQRYLGLFPVQQKELFCQLQQQDHVSIEKLKKISSVCKLDGVKSPEIKFVWLRLCLKSRYTDMVPDVLQFVTDLGRMKFIGPLYGDLYDWEEVRGQATERFLATKPFMHPISAKLVARKLHL